MNKHPFTHYRVSTSDQTELLTLTTSRRFDPADTVLADLAASMLTIVTPEHIDNARAGKFNRDIVTTQVMR